MSLPIHEALPRLRQALATHPTVILQAPPGAGKSTVVPLELMAEPWHAGQKILMLEPRRLAARSVAMRMAQTLDEKPGERVGYRVRFENKTSARTQVEVLTEGILTRLLQNDSALEGIGMIIFDEFHERSLQADLALALCRQVQQLLRPELRILIMSATLDTAELVPLLGGAPVVTSQGRQYPLTTKFLGFDQTAKLDLQMASAVRKALREQPGDVLAFLPGTAEIERLNRILEESLPEKSIVYPLYGDLPFEQQQAALEPDRQGRRKIILATSIAETSLTIEGVRIVVDSGLTRTPRFDPRSGLTRLETVRITLDSADQRAGRAARQGPGVCYRLWTEATHHQLEPRRRPEILEADLAPLLLELAQWGEEPGSLSWVTPPPPGPLAQASDILAGLEAIETLSKLKITPRGREMLALPTHPRMAHMLLEGKAAGLAALATDVAALLEERDPMQSDSGAGADLTLRVEALRRMRQGRGGRDASSLKRIERLASAWRSALKCQEDNASPDSESVGRLIALAYPDRIAGRLQAPGTALSSAYRLSSGRNASLPSHDPLEASPFLAIAHLDGGQGRIFLAAPIGLESLRLLSSERKNISWDSREGQLIARRERTVGSLVIESSPISNLTSEEKESVLVEVIRQEGLRLFNEEEEGQSRQFRARVLSLRQWRPAENWPDLTSETLAATAADWAGPYLGPIRKREDFKKVDFLQILKGLVPWDLLPRLDELAPATLSVPSGSNIKIEYFEDGRKPILAVRLQELFGLGETPAVNAGRMPVLLHLLSPGYKPVQVTQDLHSFWENTYPAVKKELKSRYPRHSWPDDPWTAEAVRGAKRRTS